MVLENLIKKLMPKRQLKVDPELLTFLIQLQKDQTQHTVQHLRKGDAGLTMTSSGMYTVYVHDSGDYQLRMSLEGDIIGQSKAHFKKPGVYLIRPHINVNAIPVQINKDGAVAFSMYSMPYIAITKFGSKNSYAAALDLFSLRIESDKKLEDLFEQAAVIKKKRDALPRDGTDYWRQVFGPELERPKPWARIGAYGLAAAVALALSGTRMYYEIKEDKLKERGWQMEHDAKDLTWKNDYERRLEEDKDFKSVQEAKQKEEDEKKKIWEENSKRAKAESLKQHQAWVNEWKTKMKDDIKTTLHDTYHLDADISDIAWEAYLSNPIQKDGRNFSATSFSMNFKEPEYKMSVHLYTEWISGEKKRTRIESCFELNIDGKDIVFNSKGQILNSEKLSENENNYILDLVEKRNLRDVRKTVIEKAIKDSWGHQADFYDGKD